MRQNIKRVMAFVVTALPLAVIFENCSPSRFSGLASSEGATGAASIAVANANLNVSPPNAVSQAGGATVAFTASGGNAPHSYSISASVGFIDSNTGVYSPPSTLGAPAIINVQVSDSSSPAQTAIAFLQVAASQSIQTVSATPTPLPPAAPIATPVPTPTPVSVMATYSWVDMHTCSVCGVEDFACVSSMGGTVSNSLCQGAQPTTQSCTVANATFTNSAAWITGDVLGLNGPSSPADYSGLTCIGRMPASLGAGCSASIQSSAPGTSGSIVVTLNNSGLGVNATVNNGCVSTVPTPTPTPASTCGALVQYQNTYELFADAVGTAISGSTLSGDLTSCQAFCNAQAGTQCCVFGTPYQGSNCWAWTSGSCQSKWNNWLNTSIPTAGELYYGAVCGSQSH